MSKPSEHLTFQYNELNKLNEQLEMMRKWGVSETDPGFLNLMTARGAAMGKIGLYKPRTTVLAFSIPGLSPGELKLWSDAEIGWKTEARAKPGAPPVYKSVSDAVAERIVKGELTHEEFMELLTPDEYIGE